MKIILSGSLGNIGRHLAPQLLAAGHDVTLISSDPGRAAAIEALGARAAIGSVSDTVFLQQAFEKADAVFAMTPPNLGGADIIGHTIRAGEAYAAAIKAAGVPRVVMLSSIGAELPSGTGPIAGLHAIEQLYRALDTVSITFLRAGFFYTNLFNDIPLIKTAGILGANYPGDTDVPLVHPRDIAAAAATALQERPEGISVRYIVSDVRRPADYAAVLGGAVGKPGLPWVAFSDEQALQGMMQAGLTAEIAGLYTEMGQALRNGKLQAGFSKEGSPVLGKTRLEDFAGEFAEAF